MNVFDLFATISLDTTDYEKNVKKAVESGENLSKKTKTVGDKVGKLSSTFSGVGDMASKLTGHFSQNSDQAEKTGKAAEDMGDKYESAGKSVGDLTAELEKGTSKAKKISELFGKAASVIKNFGIESRASRTEHKALKDELKEAESNVKALSEEYQKAAKQSGRMSDEAKTLQAKLDDAKQEAKALKDQLEQYPSVLSKAKDKLSSFGKAAGNVAQTAGNTALGALKGVASVSAKVVTVAGSALGALAGIGINYNKQMETYTTNFEVMLGSAEKSEKLVEKLNTLAAETPFEMSDLADSTQTLLAFNVSAGDSTKVLKKLGDISLGDSQKLSSLTRAYGKMNAAQKVTLEDINMMIDAGYNPLLNIQEKTGESMEDLYARISDGEVSFSEIQEAIEAATEKGGQFYEGMQKASETLEGQMSTLEDNARALVGEVMEPLTDSITKDLLPQAIGYIDQLTTAFRENGLSGMLSAAGEIISTTVASMAERAPDFVTTAFTLIGSFIEGIAEQAGSIASSAFETLMAFIGGITDNLPTLVDSAIEVVKSLSSDITENADEIVGSAGDILSELVRGILESLPDLLSAASSIIDSLGQYLVDNADDIVEDVTTFFGDFLEFLGDELPKLGGYAIDLIGALGQALIDNFPEMVEDLAEFGKKMVEAILDGIEENWWKVVNFFQENAFQGISRAIENMLPSTTKAYGNFGSSLGSKLYSHASGLDYVPFDNYPARLHEGEAVLTREEANDYRKGRGGVTIVQNIYSQAKTAADLMLEARHQQERAVLLGV